MSTKALTFKPLLFTTTMRNPARMKGLLNILLKFNDRVLTDELAENIMGEVMKYGLYRPNKITDIIRLKWGSSTVSQISPTGIKTLDFSEVQYLLINNPQNHKEAGFAKGWPSRFATIFDFSMELGFVYYKIGKPIEFSKLGIMLAESVKIEIDEDMIVYSEPDPEIEQLVFSHALAKSQRNNPFVRVLNDNVPLILLLKVINLLNKDPEYNKSGISVLELPLLIFWKNNDAFQVYNKIKEIRREYRYAPSPEVIIDICIDEIMEGEFKKFNPKSIIHEYPDEYIRKMRLTGLISLRGGGRFIDINENEIDKIDYILAQYSSYPKFTQEKEYFDYMSEIDPNLISVSTYIPTIEQNNVLLDKWVKIYSWDKIKNELLILSRKGLSKDNILRFLSYPVRLEFLTAIALKSQFPSLIVIPNYPTDDEGLPTSTAGGNKGDIECIENNNGILIEVTMSGGRTQTMMEVWPIARHLEEFAKDYEKAICLFIAPSIYIDSQRQVTFLREKEELTVVPQTINEFLNYIERNEKLFCIN